MNIKFNNNVLLSEKYTKQEFKTIISIISNKQLRQPIQRNSSKFRKEIRGFRVNRLSKEMLFQIYFERIFIKKDFHLMKHIEGLLKIHIKIIYQKIKGKLGIPSELLEKISKNEWESFNAIVNILLETPFQTDIPLFFKVIEYKMTEEQIVYCDRELPQKIEMIKKKQEIRKELTLDFNKEKQQLEMQYNKMIEKKDEEIHEVKMKLDLIEKEHKIKLNEKKRDIEELNQIFNLLEKQHQTQKGLFKNENKVKLSKIDQLEKNLKGKSNEISMLNEKIALKQEEFNVIAEGKWLEENKDLVRTHENIKLTTNVLKDKYNEVSKEIGVLTKEKDYIENKIKSLKNDSINYIEDIKEIMELIDYNGRDNQTNDRVHRINSIQLVKENHLVIDNTMDYIDDLSENLNVCGIGNEYALSVAEYIYATLANNMGLLLIGYNSRKIANAISSLTCGMSADIISAPLGFTNSGQLISIANHSESKVILLENIVDNISEFVYLPLIKQNTDKILIFSMESEEHTHILSNSLLHYLTVLNFDPVLDFNNQGELLSAKTEDHVFELDKNIDRKYNRELQRLDDVIQLSQATKYHMNRMLNALRQINAVDPLFNLIKYSILFLCEQNNKVEELNQYIVNLGPETANKLQSSKGVRL